MADEREREQARIRQQRWRDRQRQPPQPRPCAWCSSLFTPSRYAGERARYCCSNCRSQARFKRKREQRLG